MYILTRKRTHKNESSKNCTLSRKNGKTRKFKTRSMIDLTVITSIRVMLLIVDMVIKAQKMITEKKL